MNVQGEQRARGFAAGVFIGCAVLMPLLAALSPGLEQFALPLMAIATALLIAGVVVAAVGLSEVNARRTPPAPLVRRRVHPVQVHHAS